MSRPFSRPRREQLLLSLALSLSLGVGLAGGCGSQEPAPPALIVHEATWAEQLQAVKLGAAEEIIVERKPVTREEFRQLVECREQLTHLEIVNADLQPEDYQLLGECQQLEWLRLEMPMNDVALTKIARLPKLRILNLPNGSFSDEGIAQLAGASQLELLRFSSPNVTDAGLGVISQLPNLRFLHLIGVPLTDKGIKPLQECVSLESLYLDGVPVSDQALLDLLKARPQLHLHKDQMHLPGEVRTDGHQHN